MHGRGGSCGKRAGSGPLIAASVPRDGGTRWPEPVPHGRTSRGLPGFCSYNRPCWEHPCSCLPIASGHPGCLARRGCDGGFCCCPQVSRIDPTLPLCVLRQRMACCCLPCSRPCPSWTCTGHLGWSSTSPCLTSCGTSCWSGCPPLPRRGRLRKGRWAGDMCSPLLSVGTDLAFTYCSLGYTFLLEKGPLPHASRLWTLIPLAVFWRG